MRTAIPWLQDVADSYCHGIGLDSPMRGHYVPVDSQFAERIAGIYASAPRVWCYPDDIPVRRAYDALMQETRAQFLHLSANGLDMEAWLQPGQPYADSAAMQADVRDNRHLFYFTGGDYHTYLGSTNLLLRAVHDIFGHAAEGYQFGPRGEENAWLHHSMMFSPLAQRALTTETRGQNSWVNFGPHKDRPAQERPFADQKCILLPEWACDYRAALAREG